jgi:laccase
VNYNDVVEFVLVDEAIAFEMHPMHLHGNSFAFLGSEKLNDDANDIFGIKNLLTETVKKMDEKGQLKRNFDRPIMKDTIAVPTSGYAIIRFIADNPGLWFFHCHLET